MNKKNSIVLASDHAGYKLKEYLKEKLIGFNLYDEGTNNSESVDYPVFAERLANKIAYLEEEKEGENNKPYINPVNWGILICGSGIGISIAANRFKFIRAALCNNKKIAELSRQHNNANVISLGANFIEEKEALEIVNIFINTKFQREERHINRIKLLSN